MKCHKCGTPWLSEKRRPGVKDYCENCSAYLHCCRNCRFHVPSAHNQCHIPNTDWVGGREGANFCDEFEFRDSEAPSAADRERDNARAALDAIFGDVPRTKPTPKNLDDLLGG